MNETLVFRIPTAADFPEICTLVQSEEELLRFHPSGRFPLTVEQLRRLASIRTELTIASREQGIIGLASFYAYGEPERLFIGNTFISGPYRRLGFGRQLLEYMVLRAFDKFHVSEIFISVFENNPIASRLYESLGFCPYETVKRQFLTGQSLKLVRMRLPRSRWSRDQARP